MCVCVWGGGGGGGVRCYKLTDNHFERVALRHGAEEIILSYVGNLQVNLMWIWRLKLTVKNPLYLTSRDIDVTRAYKKKALTSRAACFARAQNFLYPFRALFDNTRYAQQTHNKFAKMAGC